MTANAWLATATPPTPNGDLHLGHLSGPYLAADVFTRNLRRRGADVVSLTGIDDNQSYTEKRGLQAGTSAAETARHYGGRIVDAWRAFGLDFDVVGRPDADPGHAELTSQVFETLLAQGDIVARERPLPYCVPCGRWAYEAFVSGACPHCGTGSGGNACEVCGRPNDCADLGDPHCTVCGAACELRPCERLYLPLAPHAGILKEFWDDVRMNGHLTALCDAMVTDGLPEIAVSHPADWGLPVPVDGFRDQRIYVWFEMAAGYLAAGDGVWRRDRRVVQFFGFDNGWFHAVLFPVIMRRFDATVNLPTDFVSNEFFRLDGQKFSTSRQHAIWLLDTVATAHPDHLRLYLAWNRPSVQQTNFTWADFEAVVHAGLLPRWRSWLTALARRCRLRDQSSDAGAAGPAQLPDTSARRTVDDLRRRTAETGRAVEEAYGVERFSPRSALVALDELVRVADDTGADLEHLAGRPDRHDVFVAGVDAETAAAAVLADGLEPVAPGLARQLRAALPAAPGAGVDIEALVASDGWRADR